jgi:hypothetical protein
MKPSDRPASETVDAVLGDDLIGRILRSRGGRKLVAMDDKAMREFLTSAASSLSVRPTDDPELKATIDAARAQTQRRMDVMLSADIPAAIGLVGALADLDESGYAARNCAGVSGGAIVAALLAAAYLPIEIRDVVLALDTRRLRLGRRSLVPTKELHGSAYLEAWLTEQLAAKGVATFRDLMLVPELRVSASLEALRRAFSGEVTAFDLLRDLFATHPAYGEGRAGKVVIGEAPSGARRRTVDDWFDAAGDVFEIDSSFLLDGRRLTCALAYLDGPTCELLAPDKILITIEHEIDGLEAQLSDHGRRLRDACHGGSDAEVTTPSPSPTAAARESRLQVLVRDPGSGRFLLLPRDAQALGRDPASLSVAAAVAMSAGPGAEPLPVSIFDVEDAAPQWPTFGITVVQQAIATHTADPADAARTIVVRMPFELRDDVDPTQDHLFDLYAAGRSACREFLDGWDFERWVSTFRASPPPSQA